METKRQLFEGMVKTFYPSTALLQCMEQYDNAPDDAPRLDVRGQINKDMVEAVLDWAREQGRKEAQNHEQVQQVVIDKLADLQSGVQP